MADLFDCLQSAMDAGLVDPQRGTAAQRDYQDLFERYRRHAPDAAARFHRKAQRLWLMRRTFDRVRAPDY